MSSPVSSRGGAGVVVVGFEHALERVVLGRDVGLAFLPAVPDDVEPGAGQDADGVGMVVAAGEGLAVELVGPGVGAAAVAGEVADGVAQLFVGGPAEADGAVLARLAGGGCDAGQAGQRVGGGEAGAAVADLGQQPSGAHGARAGQAGEDVGVGMQLQLLADLFAEGLDLLDQAAQYCQQGAGGVGPGCAVGAGQSAGCGLSRAYSTAGSTRRCSRRWSARR